MNYKNLILGLVPHEYPKSFTQPLPKRVVRLFGENWAFAVEGELKKLTENEHWRLTASAIWGASLLSPPEKFAFRQNFFPLDIYRNTPVEDNFPITGFQSVGRNTTELLVGKITAPNSKNQNLYHLTQGRIEVERVNNGLLNQLYHKLGLSAPAKQQSIFLYPDGFCICAKIAAPLGDEKIEGWFKLTSRSFKKAGSTVAVTHPGLELCLDPILPGNTGIDGYLAKWQVILRTIAEVFDGIAQSKAQWLSHSLTGTPSAEHLFWPVKTIDELAVERAKDGEMWLFAPFLRLMLRPGRSFEQQIGGMQIGGEVLRLVQKPNGEINITTLNTPLGDDSAMLRYNYSCEPASEVLRLGSNRRLDLAVPLIDSARMLREQSGLPERLPEYRHDPVGPLWTFTPIETGWLHWPFPDATLEGLDRLNPPSVDSVKDIQEAITGSILMGNRQGLPDYEPHHRPWQLSLANGRQGGFELILELIPNKQQTLPERWALKTANVQVTHCVATLEGAVPVVPFAQTSERLLPDHDERALRLRSLRAVSPELLQGLELRMWRHAEANKESKQLVQVKLSVLDFSLTAPGTEKATTKLDGKVQLRVRIDSHKDKEEDPSLSPWIWSRHDKLACVQTLPLAVAGAARTRPAGSHELAPLMRRAPKASLLYSFENALDMSVVSPRLIIDSKHSLGERYVAPWHKNDGAMNEIGMAVLTLPSVTLFPGTTTAPDKTRLASRNGDSWRWPVGSSGDTSFLLELRHDIALRDVLYAKTAQAAPEREPAGEAKVVAETGFSPLPTNGPQMASIEHQIDIVNSWEAVWHDNQRRAGLAASFARALVTANEQDRYLAGLIGLHEYPLAKFEFSPDTVISEQSELLHIGHVSWSLKVDNGEQKLPPLLGLPDSGDLDGFSGELDSHLFEHGTLTARGSHQSEFTDQFELLTGPLKSNYGMFHRSVGDVELYSLAKPLLATQGDKTINFWFADIPSVLKKSTPQHWADMENQHQEGLRWSVSDPDSPLETCIVLPHELYFEPLKLDNFSPPNSDNHGRLKLNGRLGIKFNGKFLPQLLRAGGSGLSTLVLEADAGGNWGWRVEFASECYLQLERAGVNGTQPALLKLAGDKFSLVFDLFGKKAEIPVERNNGCERPCFSTVANDELLAGRDNFRVAAASVLLGGARPDILLEWQYVFTRPTSGKPNDLVVQVSGRLRHPHYHGHVPEIANFGEITISLQSGDASAKLVATALNEQPERLGDGLLLINFGGLVSAAFTDSWLDRFKPCGAAGGLLALVEPHSDGNLTAPDFRFMGQITLAASSTKDPKDLKAPKDLLLQLLMTRSESVIARLFGEQDLTFGANNTGLQCTSRLHFDGNLLTSVGAQALLGAHVIHSVTSKKSSAVLRIATVQHVKLEKSAVDLSMAVVLDRDGEPARLVFMQLSDSNDDQVILKAYELPPLSRVVRSGAKRALGEALAMIATESALTWSDHLLASRFLFQAGDSSNLTSKNTDSLFEWVKAGATPAAYQLAFPEQWSMYSLAKLFHAEKDLPYTWYRDKMTEQLEKLLLAAPGEFLTLANRRGYTLFGPDVHGSRLTRLGVQTGVVAVQFNSQLSAWDRNLLASLAPWSAAGLIEAYNIAGDVQYRVIRSSSRKTVAHLPSEPWRLAGEVKPDPRKVLMPYKGLGLLASYQPASVRAVNIECIKEEDGSVIAEDIALAARALERSWQLAGTEAAGLYSAKADYWLGSRQSVAFRPANPIHSNAPSQSYRLTPETTPEAELVAASGMVVTTPLPAAVGEVTPGEQAYAPAQVLLRDISARPGVWHSRRLGLATTVREAMPQPSAQKPGLAGSEIPVHARAPRPPRTAINDRLRSNDFNAAPFSLAAQPEFVLYGPRSKSPIVPGEPHAVLREPLCRSASLGRVELPGSGLLDDRWNGVIPIKLHPLEPQQSVLNWQPKEARATLEGKTYKLTSIAVTQNNSNSTNHLEYWLTGAADSENFSESFANAARSVALSTRALIECDFELELEPGVVPLRRTAAFELPVITGHAPTEKLLSIRFEDPAYNDRLVLPAKVAKDASGTMLCADREAVRPQDLVTIAWRQPDPSPLPDAFSVTVSRTEIKEDGRADPKTILLSDLKLSVRASKEAVANLDCALLQWKDAAGKWLSFRLQVGDKLELAPTAEGQKWDEALRLTFDVTQDPMFPANSAGLALLRLDRSGKQPQLSAPLFAQSPTPTLIELIDPRDLFSGIARFRAIYQWLLFTPRETGAVRPKFMMQKIDGSGGSYLPTSLNKWIDPPC